MSFNPKGIRLEKRSDGDYKFIGFQSAITTIGRDSEKVNFVISKQVVTRVHCKVEFRSNRIFITDLKSSNGTYLAKHGVLADSQKLTSGIEVEIEEGDIIGIGCDPRAVNQVDPYNLVYIVTPMETIDLLDSDDDEHQQVVVGKESSNQEDPVNGQNGEAGIQNQEGDETDNECDDEISQLCDELINNQEDLSHPVEEVIELSDEETEADKKWKEKLRNSPVYSQQPPSPKNAEEEEEDLLSIPSSDEEEPPVDAPITIRDCVVNTNRIDSETVKVYSKAKTCYVSLRENEVDETLTSLSKGNQKRLPLSISSDDEEDDEPQSYKELQRRNGMKTLKKLQQICDPESDSEQPYIKPKRRRIQKRKTSDTTSSDEDDDRERLLYRDQQKRDAAELKQKVQKICDPDTSDSDSTLKEQKGKTDDESKSRLSQDNLECISETGSSKIKIRRTSLCLATNSLARSGPSSSNSAPPKKPIRRKTICGKAELVRNVASSSVSSIKSAPSKKPIRRRTICGKEELEGKGQPVRAENVSNAPTLALPHHCELSRKGFVISKPVPIIDAQPMRRRRLSRCDPENATKDQKQAPSTRKRRGSTYDEGGDMFSKAARLREGKGLDNRDPIDGPQDDPEEKERRKLERAERLRAIAENNRKEKEKVPKEAPSKPQHNPKIKITQTNRGDFLTSANIPKPPRRMSTTAKPPSPPPPPPVKQPRMIDPYAASASSHAQPHFNGVNIGASTSQALFSSADVNENLFANFRKQHMNTVEKPKPAEEEDPGTCNNQEFYRSLQDPTSQAPGIGFYTPLSQNSDQGSQNSYSMTPPLIIMNVSVESLKSILKKPEDGRKPKKQVTFESEKKLVQIELIEPREIQQPVEPSVEPRKIHQPITYGMHKKSHTNGFNNHPQPVSAPDRFGMLSSENQIINHVLRWDPQWIMQGPSHKPDRFKRLPSMQTSFANLKLYKDILNPLIDLEIIGKLTEANEKIQKMHKKDDKIQVVSIQQTTHEASKITTRDILKDYTKGTFLLLKRKHRDSEEEDIFFGYVSSGISAYKSEIVIETMFPYNKLKNVSVLKSSILCYIWPHLKSLIALKNLKETQLVKRMLQPLTNKLPPLDVVDLLVENPLENQLTDNQKNIIGHIVNMTTGTIDVIKGGPGTGKTRVIVGAVLELLKEENNGKILPKILVCAMSNSCVDEIATSLLKHTNNIEILRTGNYKMMNPAVQNIAVKPGTSKGDIKTLVDRAHVIITTINSSFDLAEFRTKFNFCFVDEASQCTDAEIVIPMQLNFERMVLVGDELQLQPMVSSKVLKDLKFDLSLFARITDEIKRSESPGLFTLNEQNSVHLGTNQHTSGKNQILTLTEQFRMDPEIFKFPNRTFYDGHIKSSVFSKRIALKIKPYCLFNVNSTQALTQDTSAYNRSEIRFVLKLVDAVRSLVPKEISIGIITPYTRQCEEVKKEIQKMPENDRTEVLTIDSAQGLEKDVIIWSTTRTGGMGFLVNPQRLNVALTRAKQAMYICGNFDNFMNNKLWCDLIKDSKDRKCHIQTDEDVDVDALMELIKQDH